MTYQNSYSTGNLGTAFLDNHMQSSFAAGAAQGNGNFSNVMGSLSASYNNSAQMGIVPTDRKHNLTPAQLAAQINTGGPMSVLPYIGGESVSKILFPAAGLWSIVDGVRTLTQVNRDLKADAGNYKRFDPSQLQYNQAYAAFGCCTKSV